MRTVWKACNAGLVCAVVGAVLQLTPPGATFEQTIGLKWLFKLRGPIAAPAAVAVIAIDDQTGGQLGLSNLPREWPRAVHGRLVDQLTRLGAATIVFDFDFQLPKKIADDATFAAAMEASGRVVLAEKLLGKRQPLLDRNGRQKGSVWIEKLITPIAPLSAAARGLGSFPLPKVEAAVHEFWAFKPSVGSAPTMPAVALQVHALPAYARLLALLQRADPALAASLPAAPADGARAEQLRSFMLDLRHRLSTAVNLDTRLRAFINAQSTDALAPTQSQTLRGLLGLYVGRDHRFLNFYGPPGSITTLPYHLLAADPTAAPARPVPDVAGKTVFVGFSDLYDPGQPDRFYTVYTNADGVDLSGVEVAATAFANLLTEHSVHALAPSHSAALLAAFGFVVGVLVYLLPAVAGVPLALVTTAGYGFVAYAWFGSSDLWLPLAIPLLVQAPLALFIGLVAQYLSERTKKAHATRAISLYLPAHLARDFTEKNLDSGALNRVTYSVCFASDMAGFTSIAEQLKPKELAAFLNDYFESVAAPLRRHGVDVIEFRADGIMCAWTAAEPAVAIRRRALAAALDSVAVMAQFKERHALLTQSLRIGLESGMVYVGHAGGGGHFVYSIVGDCAWPVGPRLPTSMNW